VALLEEELLPAIGAVPGFAYARFRCAIEAAARSSQRRSGPAQPEALVMPGAPLAHAQSGAPGAPRSACHVPLAVSFGSSQEAQTNLTVGVSCRAGFRMVCGERKGYASGFAALALGRSLPSRHCGRFAPMATTNPAPFQSKKSEGHFPRKGSRIHRLLMEKGRRHLAAARDGNWRWPPRSTYRSRVTLRGANPIAASRSALHIRGSALPFLVRLCEARGSDLPPQVGSQAVHICGPQLHQPRGGQKAHGA